MLLLTKERKRELMRDIAESTTPKTQDQLRAIEIDAKLAGHFEPEQMVVETGPKTLDAVRERAQTMASLFSRIGTHPATFKTTCPNPIIAP